MISTKIKFLFITVFSSLLSLAQNDEVEDLDVNQQLWIDYNISYKLKNNFSLYGDAGYRIISPDIWTRYYMRPSISYNHLSRIKSKRPIEFVYHFGIGTFFTNNNYIPNQLEIRPFQGVQLRWPNFKHISFSHYARLEQQIHYFNKNWDFGLRARYMLGGDITWGINDEGKIYLPFHVEFFWNIDNSKNFNDVIRLTPGIGYHFSKHWSAEFSASYHRRKFSEADNFATNDIVFRLRIYHDIF